MNQPKKISPHFFYHELFSKGIWQTYSETTLKKLIDPRTVKILEMVRNDLGISIHCNNWFWGGPSQYRGFRPASTQVGALYSQHKFGRAIDFKTSITPKKVQTMILENERRYMKAGLTRMEDTRDARTWVHLDLAWTGSDKIVIFRG